MKIRTLAILFFCIAIFLTVDKLKADQITATWLGGIDYWSEPTNWSIGVVPNNDETNTYNVLIDNIPTTDSVVTLNMNATIDNLTVDSDDVLKIGNGRTFTVVSGTEAGTIVNNGDVIVHNADSWTYLRINGNVTILGTGYLTLDDPVTLRAFLTGVNSSDRLTNEAGHTIQGIGRIGYNQMTLTNRGLIDPNGPNTLIIDPSSDVINNGTLQSSNGGTLKLEDGTFDNTSGIIQALDDSIVQLQDVSISGGILSTVGTGQILPQTTTTFEDITNAGNIIVNSGCKLYLESTFTNNGSIIVHNTGSDWTYLRINGNVTILGTGYLTLDDPVT